MTYNVKEVQLRQIFWYWILGMAIGSLVSVFAKDRIHGLFSNMKGKKWGLLGIVPACLLGIASPLFMAFSFVTGLIVNLFL